MKQFTTILLLSFLFLSIPRLQAQSSTVLTKDYMMIVDLAQTTNLENVEFLNHKIKIKNHKGSPMLFSKWQEASIQFIDGKHYTLPFINYDATNDNFIVEVNPELVKEFGNNINPELPLVKFQNSAIVSVLFTDGNRHFINIPSNHFKNDPHWQFFEYFSQNAGKAYFVVKHTKEAKKTPTKVTYISEVNDDYKYVKTDTYYFKNQQGEFVETSLKKSKILKSINDKAHENQLKKYIKSEHLRLKKPEDVQKLLKYYHQVLLKK